MFSRAVSVKRLKKLLHYDPKTGVWRWLRAHRKIKVGDRAGYLDHGYWRVGIDGKYYKMARLAFLYMRGKWPPHDVDHKNLKRDDDRWCNLRLATRSQNSANKLKRNKFKGVHWSKLHKQWRAQIKVRGETRHLGLFRAPEKAAVVYQAAAQQYFGEFAR